MIAAIMENKRTTTDLQESRTNSRLIETFRYT